MAGRFRRRAALRAAVVVALAVVVDPIGAVQAQNVPTDREVERARDAEQRADDAVADAQARLGALAAELDEVRIRAATAVEAYNGARVELARARRAEEAAVAGAAVVRDERSSADVELGRLAAAAYRSGGGMSELGVVVNIVTDAAIADVSEALAAVTRSRSAVRARWTAALDDARSAVRDAERQVAERAAIERDAELTLERAKNAVAEHEDAVARAEAMRDDLLAELAAARGTTTELERERRRAAEQREQNEREQAERRRAGGEQPAGPGAGERAEQSPERGSGEAPPRERAGHEQAAPDRQDEAEPDAPAGGESTGRAEPAAAFAGAAAAERAVDYARAQIGKPYVWAGAGPAGFDCSGLTMRAWERGGVQLTHWSVAQARQTVAVSYSDLRPGDLIFWSANDAPSGTYHVALYTGGGEMIHAPSPGGQVEVRDVFYWRTPSFYARVVA